MTFWRSEDIETSIDALNSADLAELKANSK